MSEKLTHEAFLEQLNSKLRLELEGAGAIELQLIEVSELRSGRKQESFSIEFRGPSTSLLPQRIYQLVHEEMGSFELFLVPVRRDSEGVYYEAVFNRLL